MLVFGIFVNLGHLLILLNPIYLLLHLLIINYIKPHLCSQLKP